ncbi:MAG: hypothetical protein PHP86_06865 [Nevskiales bacterium]|nr:hypothetical protein [Nevskiales bacterium]
MNAWRMLFLSVAGVILVGIGLTGFDTVQGFLYLPVIFLTFAGLTGICALLIFWSKLGLRTDPPSCELPRRLV